MIAIKLRPVGKKKQRSFRIVVAEKRSKLTGKFIEDLGWFNPHTDDFSLNKEQALYWLKNGAQPTDTVHNLLVKAGVIKGPKKPVHAKPKRKEGEEQQPNEVQSQSAPAANQAQAESQPQENQPSAEAKDDGEESAPDNQSGAEEKKGTAENKEAEEQDSNGKKEAAGEEDKKAENKAAGEPAAEEAKEPPSEN